MLRRCVNMRRSITEVSDSRALRSARFSDSDRYDEFRENGMRLSRVIRAVLTASIAVSQLFSGLATASERSGPWKFGQIVVEQAWARMSPDTPKTATVYLTIRNKSSDDDLLLAVESPAAQSSAVYASSATSGKAAQDALPFGVPLPGRGEIALKPDGIHIVLVGLSGALKPGDLLPVRMVFRDQGPIDFEIRVALSGEPDPAIRHAGHKL